MGTGLVVVLALCVTLAAAVLVFLYMRYRVRSAEYEAADRLQWANEAARLNAEYSSKIEQAAINDLAKLATVNALFQAKLNALSDKHRRLDA